MLTGILYVIATAFVMILASIIINFGGAIILGVLVCFILRRLIRAFRR